MIRLIIGVILIQLFVLCLATSPKNEATRTDFLLGGAVLMLLPGIVLTAWGVRSLKRRSAAKSQKAVTPAPAPVMERPHALSAGPADARGWTASHVLVFSKTKVVDAASKQIEERLVRSVVALPSIPLSPHVSLTTLRGEDLPANTRQAVEPLVWTFQRRFALDTGGPWHADFYDHAGFSFMVLYLG